MSDVTTSDVAERLAQIVAEESGGSITAADVDADFSLDLDRLTLLSIVTAVEDEFGVRLELATAREAFPTVSALVEHLAELLASR